MSLCKLVQFIVLIVQHRGCFLATGLASLTSLKALCALSSRDLGGVTLDKAFDLYNHNLFSIIIMYGQGVILVSPLLAILSPVMIPMMCFLLPLCSILTSLFFTLYFKIYFAAASFPGNILERLLFTLVCFISSVFFIYPDFRMA